MEIDVVRYGLIGAAMQVHGELGSGFQEVVYQRALGVELSLRGIAYEREKEMRILYKGQDIGSRRVDFYVEGCVMVELKAVSELTPDHLAQAKNYVEAYGVAEGLLINFGEKSLVYKRLYPRGAKG
jgi:GxxExxY protein